jgi:hypothetical protein
LPEKGQIWWGQNDTAQQHIGNLKIYDRKRTDCILRKNVQIWWVKNDTSAHIGNLKMTEKEHIYAKMTQQQLF